MAQARIIAQVQTVRSEGAGGLSNYHRGLKHANAAKSDKAVAQAENLLPKLRDLEAAGVRSLVGIAAALNAQGIPAPRGGQWSATQVSRVKARLKRAV